VMQSKKMRSSNTVLFLTALALADLTVLTFSFMGNMIKLYKINFPTFCFSIQVFPQLTAFISIWIMVATTIERLFAVVTPLQVNGLFTRKLCHKIVITIIVFFSCLTSTISFCQTGNPRKPYYCLIRGQRGEFCYYYKKKVYPWIGSAFNSWLPSLICVVCNAAIIVTLCRTSHHRHYIVNSGTIKIQARSIKKKDRQLTMMLCTISISFIAFTLPFGIFELLRNFNFKYDFLKSRDHYRLFNSLIHSYHATNFFLYCLSGQKFRHELKSQLQRYFCSFRNLKIGEFWEMRPLVYVKSGEKD